MINANIFHCFLRPVHSIPTWAAHACGCSNISQLMSAYFVTILTKHHIKKDLECVSLTIPKQDHRHVSLAISIQTTGVSICHNKTDLSYVSPQGTTGRPHQHGPQSWQPTRDYMSVTPTWTLVMVAHKEPPVCHTNMDLSHGSPQGTTCLPFQHGPLLCQPIIKYREPTLP